MYAEKIRVPTPGVIAYRSLELLFSTHTFHFNCFYEDLIAYFTQIRCLSRGLCNLGGIFLFVFTFNPTAETGRCTYLRIVYREFLKGGKFRL